MTQFIQEFNVETFYGKVKTVQQAVALMTACISKRLPVLRRRLSAEERQKIRSGSVFVYEERDSMIQRWTDGRFWSASRCQGNFLVYLELERSAQEPVQKKCCEKPSDLPFASVIHRGRRFLKKPDGLLKKTFSVDVCGQKWHLVSYINQQDEESDLLQTPDDRPEISSTLSQTILFEPAHAVKQQTELEISNCRQRLQVFHNPGLTVSGPGMSPFASRLPPLSDIMLHKPWSESNSLAPITLESWKPIQKSMMVSGNPQHSTHSSGSLSDLASVMHRLQAQ